MSTVLCENVVNSKELINYVNEFKKQKDNNITGYNEVKDCVSFNFNKTLDGLKFLKYMSGIYKTKSSSKIKMSLQISKNDNSRNSNPINSNILVNANKSLTNSNNIKNDNSNTLALNNFIGGVKSNLKNSISGQIQKNDSKKYPENNSNNSPLKLSRETTNQNLNTNLNKNIGNLDSKKGTINSVSNNKVIINNNNKNDKLKDKSFPILNQKKNSIEIDYIQNGPKSIILSKLNSNSNFNSNNNMIPNQSVSKNVNLQSTTSPSKDKDTLKKSINNKADPYKNLIQGQKQALNSLNLKIPEVSNKSPSKLPNNNLKSNTDVKTASPIKNKNTKEESKNIISASNIKNSNTSNKEKIGISKTATVNNNKSIIKENNSPKKQSPIKNAKNDSPLLSISRSIDKKNSVFITKIPSNNTNIANNIISSPNLIKNKSINSNNINKNQNSKNNNTNKLPDINLKNENNSSLIRRQSVLNTIKLDNEKFINRHDSSINKRILSPLKTLVNKSINDSLSTKSKTISKVSIKVRKNKNENIKAKQFWNNISNIHKSFKDAQKSRSKSTRSYGSKNKSRPRSNSSNIDHRVFPLSSK